MNINFTIVVQAIHFFLAYLILTKFFISPALEALMKQEQTDRELLLELSMQTKKLEEKSNKQVDLWNENLVKFSINRPEVIQNKIKFNWPDLNVKKPTDSAVFALKKEVSHFLKDKIRHVR